MVIFVPAQTMKCHTVFFGVIRFSAKKVRHLRLDVARSLK